MGALLIGRISSELSDVVPADEVDDLLSTPEDVQALEPSLREAVESAVAVASNAVFWCAVPVMAVFVVAVMFVPELELRTTTAVTTDDD